MTMPGEAKEHPGRGETSDGHRSNDVRDKGAKIAARAAALQEKRRRDGIAESSAIKLQYQKLTPESLSSMVWGSESCIIGSNWPNISLDITAHTTVTRQKDR